MQESLGTVIKFIIITAGIAVGFWKKDKLSAANQVFWIFLIVAAGCETLDVLMGKYYGNNRVYYHVSKPLTYALLTLALSNEIGRTKNFFLWSILLVVILSALNAYFLQSPGTDLNTNIIVLTSLLLILQVLFFIARLFEEANRQQMMYEHSFWIALGILILSITSFLTLGLYNVLMQEGHAKIIPYLIISEWIFYGAFLVNFLVQKPAQPPPNR
ncbi:MAG TPA: hypothetical protein PLQ32_06430 [Flavihumibacter sp.]|nr:hypothetical protein [Bacteroidota bacterium]HPZ87719.1 hypothetical protein [Flavihumibacter sp.]HQD10642.1 hypothetical protein [Flavihumibacter sp.]